MKKLTFHLLAALLVICCISACKKHKIDDPTTNSGSTNAARLQQVLGTWRMTAEADDENDNGAPDETEKTPTDPSTNLSITFASGGGGSITEKSPDTTITSSMGWEFFNDYQEMKIAFDGETSFFVVSSMNSSTMVLQSEDSIGSQSSSKSWFFFEKTK